MNIQELLGVVNAGQLKAKVADVRVGETVKVHYKIREGNKERIQIFEGLIIATKSGKSLQGSFTVRKVVSSIGVERTFPLHSPWIVKIERVKSGKTRQAKLNYVRNFALSSRFKLRDKGVAGESWANIEEPVAIEPETADNSANDQTEQGVGELGRDVSSELPPKEEIPDSQPESSH